MKALTQILEAAWLWTYTAGMPAGEADDRRAEVRSDRWEYSQFVSKDSRLTGDPFRRLAGGVGDDIAWRASFGRRGLAAARSPESVLLIGLASLFFVGLPASIWWAVALAGEPGQPGLQVWYIATEAVALLCTVVGGAALAAHYPRAGRALMLAGSASLAATLWWALPVAVMVLVAASVVIICLSTAPRPDELL